MGLLGKLAKDALNKGVEQVTKGVSEGISKGVSAAVGKAAETIIAPKVNELAENAAVQLDQTTKALNENGATINNSLNEATEALNEANGQAVKTEGFAGLEKSLGRYMESVNAFATEMSTRMKHCSNCGEDVLSSSEFCPNCGAKLPEETISAQYVCPKCGKQNSVETKFCVDCGSVLPWYEEEAEEEARIREEEKAEEERLAKAEAERKAKEEAAKEAAAKAAAEAKKKAQEAFNVGSNLVKGFFKK